MIFSKLKETKKTIHLHKGCSFDKKIIIMIKFFEKIIDFANNVWSFRCDESSFKHLEITARFMIKDLCVHGGVSQRITGMQLFGDGGKYFSQNG